MLLLSSNILAESAYQKRNLSSKKIDFEFRKNVFFNMIAEKKPDLLLLQEADEPWFPHLDGYFNKHNFSYSSFKSRDKYQIIAWNNENLHKVEDSEYNSKEPGIQSIDFICKNSKTAFRTVNIHAPYNKASDYEKVYEAVLTSSDRCLMSGDFNIDDNPNAGFFYTLTGTLGYQNHCSNIPFTARSVKHGKGELLDFVYSLNLNEVKTHIVPSDIKLLIPHSEVSDFDEKNCDNHYSDHAALFAEFYF